MPDRIYTNRRYLDLIAKKVVVFDGAMGTSLQKMELTAKDFGGEKLAGCNDYLVISSPTAIEKVHRSFLEAGVDVIETDTFRSNRITLAEYGLENRVIEINKTAAQLAKRIADEFSTIDHPRLVAGSIGPSGKLPSMEDPQLSDVGFLDLADVFCEQAIGLIEGGVDLLLIETSQDILEVKACINGINKAFEKTNTRLPIQAQVTLDTNGRMLLGTDIEAVRVILEGLPIEVIGMNCSTGPDHMREPIRMLSEQTELPISCIPNAGLPLNVDGQAVYPMLPEPFSDLLTEFIEKFGIRVVGGCCGTTPEHLKLLVDKTSNIKPIVRSVPSNPSLASSISATAMIQEPRPFLIGERLNTQGSLKFKRVLMAEDFDGVVEIARQQIEGGAHGLDICTALTERLDEKDLMRRVIKKLSTAVKAPFIIDSTEPDVIEIALISAPGRCLINSTNFESGPEKARKVFGLAKTYNAAVIALTIDEKGMAKTAERKLEVATRLYKMAVEEFGLNPGDLVIDSLTFTMATGDPEFQNSALETIKGIELIKKNLPGVLTSLGVSNVSFGLTPPSRAVLNSIMLHHCVQAGLDMAIVNPAQITPYADIAADEKKICEDLILNSGPDALQAVIDHFSNHDGSEKADTKKDPLEGLSAGERLHWKILHRRKEGVETDIDELILQAPPKERHTTAVFVLNEVLLPAMKDVGDKFGAGELILPFVLQSAEVMKKSVTHLEQYLEKKEGTSKGMVVLATVYGDVHDIGKNLVKTILSNNGYDVTDLGKQVPAETIIEKAIELKADAIGLSALLVSTSKQMPLIVNELHRRNLHFPVLIGGAAINRKFGQRILQTEDGNYYDGGVYYCKDAFEGLFTLDQLRDPSKKSALNEKMVKEADFESERSVAGIAKPETTREKSSIEPILDPPTPPDWQTHYVQNMPLKEVFAHLSLNELFRLSWGAKNLHGEEWEKLQKDYTERLSSMLKQAEKSGWLKPQGVYGFFPCQTDGDDLVVFDSATIQSGNPKELERFTFPRQKFEENLSLADYFLPKTSGKFDIVAFQIATVGLEATERFDKLQSDGNFSEGYYTHGLAVQTAEAAADYLHAHIRRELKLKPNQGKRYSWGYPAIPELSDHEKVFRLLPAAEKMGMKLTSAYQLVPEQSTAAIIVHHPQARYFNIGESRIEQLTRSK